MKKKDKDITLNISTKHVKLRVAIFAVSLVIAIGSISYGVYSCSNQNMNQTGWVKVNLSKYADSKYIGYGNNMHLSYYVDSTDNVKQVNKNIINIFVDKAKSIYSLIDANPSANYKTNGISTLNSNLNTRLEINETLYNILSDALTKTNDGTNTYSIYSGLINTFWSNTFAKSKLENKNYDPLVNSNSKMQLDSIVEVCKDLSNFNLVLENDNGYYATLTVDEKVISVVEDYGINPTYLDLNSLFYAYYIDNVKEAFIDTSYTKGYIYSDTGEMTFMSDSFTSTNDIIIYDNEKLPTKVGVIANKGKCNVSSLRTFAVETSDNYYSFTNSGNKINRSLNYNYLTGYPTDSIKNSTLVSKETNLVDLTYKNLSLALQEDKSLYKTSLTSEEYASVILKDEQGVVYLSDSSLYYNDYNNESYNRKNL